MTLDIDTVFRDSKVKNDPHSGEHWPEKPEIRALLKQIQNSGGQSITRNTVAALNGVTPPSENYMGVVLTGTGAGYYYRSGGTWVKGRGFPDSFARLTGVSGTNNITASVEAGVTPSEVQMFVFTPVNTNTGSMQINIAGQGALPLRDFDGQALEAGFVQAGKPVLLYDNGDGNYRLFLDHRFQLLSAETLAARDEAVVAQGAAETAQGAAETARDLSEEWAELPEDEEVEAGKYSALHHAAKADEARELTYTARDATLVAKDDAVAASEAAGVNHWEDTYADAEAALGGYAEGDIVGVFADETKGGGEVRYRVESGALVEKLDVDRFLLDASDAVPVNLRRLRERTRIVDEFGVMGTDAQVREALRKAVQRCAEDEVTLSIDRPLTVPLSDAAHPIEMLSNLHMQFHGAGKIIAQGFGLPLFWAKDASGITIEDARIVEDATAQTSLPPAAQDFYDDVLQRVENSFPLRDIYTMMGFYGGSDIRLFRPRFKAQTMALETLLHKAITLAGGEDGEAITGVEIIDPHFDGVRWGILGFDTDQVAIRGARSDRWGQLATGTYTWDAPGHVVYMSTLNGGNSGLNLSDCVDYGRMVEGSAYEGALSFKARDLDDFKLEGLMSRRAPGILDVSGRNGLVNGLVWRGDDPAAFSGTNAAKPVRVLNDGVLNRNISIKNAKLTLPDTNVEAITVGISDASISEGIEVEATVTFAGESHAAPFVIVAGNDCSINLTLDIPALTTPSLPIAVRIDASGSDNDVVVYARSGNADDMRIVENSKTGSTDNTAFCYGKGETGEAIEKRWLGGGMLEYTVTKTVVLDCTDDATLLEIPSFIPGGAKVHSLGTYVATAIGTSKGLVDYIVGTDDPYEVNNAHYLVRYGINAGLVQGSGTQNASWRPLRLPVLDPADTPYSELGWVDLLDNDFYPQQSVSLKITGRGGPFDGTGAIAVTAKYTYTARGSDIY